MNRSYLLFIALLGAAAALIAPRVAHASGADVSTVIAAKAVIFLQIGPEGPQIEDSPWTMYTEVDESGTGSVLGARFAPSGGSALDLFFEGPGLFDFTQSFDTQAQLNAAFPDGTFFFDIDTSSTPTSYQPVIDVTQPFPNAVPTLLNQNWYSVLLQFTAFSDAAFSWNSFSNFQSGGAHPSKVEFLIRDIFGTTVFDQFFASPVTSTVIPVGTLQAGELYIGALRFENNNETLDGTTSLLGTTGIETEFLVSAVDGPPVIQSPLDLTVTAGELFIYIIDATNDPGSFTANNLPDGVIYDGFFGLIGGFPTTPGTYQLPMGATNSVGTGSATLTLHVEPAPALAITSSTSAAGKVGNAFSFQVLAPGATTAARLSTSGLPAGLKADAVSGLISGVPQAEGNASVMLTVTDGTSTATGRLDLIFSADPAFPAIKSASSVNLVPGQSFSYQINGATTSNSTDPTTYTLVGPLPAGLSFDSKTGTISGIYGGAAQHDGSGGTRTRLSGGALIGNVQLFANNSRGTSSIPLVFFSAPSGAVNISTRMVVGTDDNALIGGFIITGNAPKKLVIRATGPSLTPLGVAGALQDPMLEIHDGAGALLTSNDDWKNDQMQDVLDSGVAPRDDHESAIVAAFAPGSYTAIVRGKNGGTGIGLVELYDLGTAALDASSDAKLANISTRGVVQTGDNVMIGGFIISGTTNKVIARAIGPELTKAGVPGALQDTTLELHGPNGDVIASNDDWRSSQEQEIIATTVPPTDDREAAIVATLPPGNYTAIVRGFNDAAGAALVEIYSLP